MSKYKKVANVGVYKKQSEFWETVGGIAVIGFILLIALSSCSG